VLGTATVAVAIAGLAAAPRGQAAVIFAMLLFAHLDFGTPQCALGFERGQRFASSRLSAAMDDLSPGALSIGRFPGHP
jgi:hypothetical protein